MPTSLNLKAALRSGKTAKGGNAGQPVVCRHGGRREEVAAGSTPHFTSLIWKPVPALVVASRQESADIITPVTDMFDGMVTFEATITGLLRKTIALLGLPSFHNSSAWLTSEEMLALTSHVKSSLPTGLKLDIGFQPGPENHYYLLLWSSCEWEFQFYAASLGAAWNALQANESARELLIRSLSLLNRKCDVVFWYQIHGGWLIDQLIENTAELEEGGAFADTPEELIDYVADLAVAKEAVLSYTSGPAYEASQELEVWSEDTITTADLRRIAGGFEELPALQKVVEEICELVDNRLGLEQFNNSETLYNVGAMDAYRDCWDSDVMDGVGLTETVAIMWDNDDPLAHNYLNVVDARAQEAGCQEPSCVIKIDLSTERIDLAEFLKKKEWPQKLQLTLDRLNVLFNQIAFATRPEEII